MVQTKGHNASNSHQLEDYINKKEWWEESVSVVQIKSRSRVQEGKLKILIQWGWKGGARKDSYPLLSKV